MTPRVATQGRDGKGGFALIEVMLALMLIAVLAALALPGMVRATGPAALRVTAFQVAALLRGDRNVAQSARRTISTRIDSRGARVSAGSSTAAIEMPAGTTAFLQNAMSPGILFFADGRSSGGAMVIASATARYVVSVNRDTGAIRVGDP